MQVFFFAGDIRGTLFVREVKFCLCLYTVYLEMLKLFSLFVFTIHRTNEMLG